MLKINELKQGDIVTVTDEDVKREGTVVSISHDDNKALVNNGVQEFWYSPNEMAAIPLSEEQLMKLGFVREEGDGFIKYKKDSFRLVTAANGDFSNIEMWWREDKRHFKTLLGVHQLQNLHLDMTKVHLEKH